jgi:hypothetical protein
MSQKVRENLIGTTDLATSAREQGSVRQVMQGIIRVGGAASYGVHVRTLHPQIWTYLLPCGDVFRTENRVSAVEAAERTRGNRECAATDKR